MSSQAHVSGAGLDAGARSARVLVVVADASERERTRVLLEQFGCKVALAESGEAGVAAFEHRRPDCVLIDAHLPDESGLVACARIKQLAGDSFIPILMVAADPSGELLVRCAQAGADECLRAPAPAEVLQANVRAWRQIGELHDRLMRQHEELLAYRAAAREEQRTAKALMHHVIRRESYCAANLRMLESPAENYHGDIVLSAWGPAGRQHVLVGDFTGHGLQAALGALPAADIFYSMTRSGFGVADIVRELNRRLHSLFPRNVFLCACAMEIDHVAGTIGAWNGGLPPAFVRDEHGGLRPIESQHLPLGVPAPRDFNDGLQFLRVQRTDRVYVYSDGLTEQLNSRGEAFEEERLRAILGGRGDAALVFERLEMALSAHRREQAQGDDITLLELRIDPSVAPRFVSVAQSAGATRAPLRWSFEVRLDAAALRELDPRPLLLRALHELQGLDSHRDALHMILSELYNNALDHGVLRCDSSLKNGPDGFEAFQRERQRRLESLERGSIWVRLDHEPEADGGVLQIRVRDDGAGFDPALLTPAAASATHGRGLALVRAFCDSFDVADGGRMACAVYRWRQSESDQRAA